MKTQKELPKEFTFVCDENSREQLEKLGIINKYGITIGFDRTYVVIDRYIIDFKDENYLFNSTEYDNYPLINLADYIEQEQPELIGTIPASDNFILRIASNSYTGDTFEIKKPKWQEKTRGGFEYHIYEEFNGYIWGRIKIGENWYTANWDIKKGLYLARNPKFDLLPINHELTTLQKELEEVRSKEKEILEKIEQLKTK